MESFQKMQMYRKGTSPEVQGRDREDADQGRTSKTKQTSQVPQSARRKGVQEIHCNSKPRKAADHSQDR